MFSEMFNVLFNKLEKSTILSKIASDIALRWGGSAADILKGRDAIQRNLIKLQRWTCRNLVKIRKVLCVYLKLLYKKSGEWQAR